MTTATLTRGAALPPLEDTRRFRVYLRGRAFWHIVDLTTGRVVGFDRNVGLALERAHAMECKRND